MKEGTAYRLAAAASHSHARAFQILMHFGVPGLMVVSFIDASIIPLPLPGSTDLLLLLLVAHRANALWMALAATVGSIPGGYLTWGTGEKGGEAAIKKYVPKRYSARLQRWVRAHGAGAVALSALLPPPIPLLPFLLAAGALGVSRKKFLLSFSVARAVRYGFVAWLAATYGRKVIHAWSHYLAHWGPVITWSLVGLFAGAALFGLWRFYRIRHGETARSAGHSLAKP